MPHITKHTPKPLTRSVSPYVRESSRKKLQRDRQKVRQTDRQTHTHTHSDGLLKPLFSTFQWLYTSQIQSYVNIDFIYDVNTYM